MLSRARPSLLTRSDGGAAIEFAFAFPLLILVIVGIMEFSMAWFAGMVLEGAVRDTARFGLTGSTPAGVSRADAILALVRARSLGIVQLEHLDLQTKVYPSFRTIGDPEPFTDAAPLNQEWDPGESFTDVNGNGRWDSDMGRSDAGGAGDIVLYSVTAEWPLLTGLLAPLFGGDRLQLRSALVVRNEPFGVP